MPGDLDGSIQRFKTELKRRIDPWITRGLPSRQALDTAADELLRWKAIHGVAGLWPRRPLMLTATLDDGIGQGLKIIQRYADILGIDIVSLGLLQDPEAILAACRKHEPDFLGLTILQLDSDDDLCRVGHGLPSKTLLIAGGPVFKFDPEMAERCKVGYVARDVAFFIEFLLDWSSGP